MAPWPPILPFGRNDFWIEPSAPIAFRVAGHDWRPTNLSGPNFGPVRNYILFPKRVQLRPGFLRNGVETELAFTGHDKPVAEPSRSERKRPARYVLVSNASTLKHETLADFS